MLNPRHARSRDPRVALVPIVLEEGGGEVMEVLEKETVEGTREEAEKAMEALRLEAVGECGWCRRRM